MWLLIAEMLLALGVIVFIMWWTMRARIDRPILPPHEPNHSKGEEPASEQKNRDSAGDSR
ncbi:MAG TPA: hypothetical protein VFV43_04270 [Limnobacter sp.]|nr:hypothetical protein [Limnobacter sp.]